MAKPVHDLVAVLMRMPADDGAHLDRRQEVHEVPTRRGGDVLVMRRLVRR